MSFSLPSLSHYLSLSPSLSVSFFPSFFLSFLSLSFCGSKEHTFNKSTRFIWNRARCAARWTAQCRSAMSRTDQFWDSCYCLKSYINTCFSGTHECKYVESNVNTWNINACWAGKENKQKSILIQSHILTLTMREMMASNSPSSSVTCCTVSVGMHEGICVLIIAEILKRRAMDGKMDIYIYI